MQSGFRRRQFILDAALRSISPGGTKTVLYINLHLVSCVSGPFGVLTSGNRFPLLKKSRLKWMRVSWFQIHRKKFSRDISQIYKACSEASMGDMETCAYWGQQSRIVMIGCVNFSGWKDDILNSCVAECQNFVSGKSEILIGKCQ